MGLLLFRKIKKELKQGDGAIGGFEQLKQTTINQHLNINLTVKALPSITCGITLDETTSSKL